MSLVPASADVVASSSWMPMPLACFDHEGREYWLSMSTLLLAMYGLGCLFVQFLQMLASVLDIIHALKFLMSGVGRPQPQPHPVDHGHLDPDDLHLGPDPDTTLELLTQHELLWACDNIRASHTFHCRQSCSQFKHMTKPWPMKLCKDCKDHLQKQKHL